MITMSFKEIVRDVSESLPTASLDEISYAIVSAIELSLPNVIQSIRTPLTSSPISTKSRELRLQRARKGLRTTIKEQQMESDEFVREIAKLRMKLDGTASPILPTKPDSANSSNYFIWEKLPNIAAEIGRPHLDTRSISDDAGAKKENQTSDPIWPYASGYQEPIPQNAIKFAITSDLQARLGSEDDLASVMASVEVAIRTFASNYKLRWNFDVGAPTDIEEPSWKKIVLRIHPSDMDFEDSMKIWERIDKSVRDAIKSLTDKIGPDGAQALHELNKNFFVEMELNE